MKKLLSICLLMLIAAAPAWADGQPGLAVGTPAPDFHAVTYDGREIILSEVNEEAPVVLVFYRGGWCPYCNRQLQDLQSHLDDFDAQGAEVIAVSVDLQENAAKTVEENQLGFDVVSDPDAKLLAMYNVLFTVPGDLAKKYKEEYHIDLEGASGRADHVIAVPATYVINEEGTIVYAHADENYKIRPSADEIIEVLKKLKPPAGI